MYSKTSPKSRSSRRNDIRFEDKVEEFDHSKCQIQKRLKNRACSNSGTLQKDPTNKSQVTVKATEKKF